MKTSFGPAVRAKGRSAGPQRLVLRRHAMWCRRESIAGRLTTRVETLRRALWLMKQSAARGVDVLQRGERGKHGAICKVICAASRKRGSGKWGRCNGNLGCLMLRCGKIQGKARIRGKVDPQVAGRCHLQAESAGGASDSAWSPRSSIQPMRLAVASQFSSKPSKNYNVGSYW